ALGRVAEREHADRRRMRQPADGDVDGALLRLGGEILDAPQRALLAHEDDAVVDVGAAEVLVVLGKPVFRLAPPIPYSFPAHVAEQQVVPVAIAFVDVHLVADLAGRASIEAVLEIGLEQRAPEIVEHAREALGASALSRGNDDAHVLRGKRLRERAWNTL